MSKAEEFQKHAETCQDMATRETDADFRSSWLAMARSWLLLLEQERRRTVERGPDPPKERPDQLH